MAYKCPCESCNPLPLSNNFERTKCAIGYHIERVLYLGGLFWTNGGSFSLRIMGGAAASPNPPAWKAEMRDWGMSLIGNTSGANEYFGIGDSPLEAILNLERVMKRVSNG